MTIVQSAYAIYLQMMTVATSGIQETRPCWESVIFVICFYAAVQTILSGILLVWFSSWHVLPSW